MLSGSLCITSRQLENDAQHFSNREDNSQNEGPNPSLRVAEFPKSAVIRYLNTDWVLSCIKVKPEHPKLNKNRSFLSCKCQSMDSTYQITVSVLVRGFPKDSEGNDCG